MYQVIDVAQVQLHGYCGPLRKFEGREKESKKIFYSYLIQAQ